MVLQQLLAEAGSGGAGPGWSRPTWSGGKPRADGPPWRSPENYTGYARTENFASPGGPVPGQPHAYAAPAELRLNHWSCPGPGTMGEQAATASQPGGQIAYRFHARDLDLGDNGARRTGHAGAVPRTIDGQPPGAAHGADMDGQGHGTVTGSRVYQLIRQPGPVTDRSFEITFPGPGVQADAFTFG